MIFCKNCHWCPSHSLKGDFNTHCYQGFKLEVINKNAHKPWKNPKYMIVQRNLKICLFRTLKGSGPVITRLQRIGCDVDIV